MIRLDTVSVPEVSPAAPPEVMVAPLLRVTAPAVPVPERVPPLLLVIAPAVPKSFMVPALVTVPTVPPEFTVRVVPEAAVNTLEDRLPPLAITRLPTLRSVAPL